MGTDAPAPPDDPFTRLGRDVGVVATGVVTSVGRTRLQPPPETPTRIPAGFRTVGGNPDEVTILANASNIIAWTPPGPHGRFYITWCRVVFAWGAAAEAYGWAGGIDVSGSVEDLSGPVSPMFTMDGDVRTYLDDGASIDIGPFLTRAGTESGVSVVWTSPTLASALVRTAFTAVRL